MNFWSRFREIVLAGQTNKEIRTRRIYSAARAWGKSTLVSKWLENYLLRVARKRRRE
jgi:hypothetical protein